LTKQTLKPKCPFCNFRDSKVVICEDKVAFAIVSKNAVNNHHALVIPKRHYEAFADLPDDVASHVFLMAKQVSQAIRLACSPDAISHLSDDEISWKGFNQVTHYKFHVIPRFKTDRVEINWHRRKDPGLRERSRYAAQIRHALTAQEASQGRPTAKT